MSFTCPKCKAVSHSMNDEKERAVSTLEKKTVVSVDHFKCGCGQVNHLDVRIPREPYDLRAGGLAFEAVQLLAPVELQEGDVLEVTVKMNRRQT